MENNDLEFIKKLKNVELCGYSSQKIFAPKTRKDYTLEDVIAENPKYAAVNILLYKKDNEWFFPLILRTSHEKDQHSGQISLPGGKKEQNDADFAATAMRETTEELGTPLHEIELIRELSPIYIPPSNFFVNVFLSYHAFSPKFNIQEREVQKVIECPIDFIKNLPKTPSTMNLKEKNLTEVPYFEIENHIVWGATSMILSELCCLLKKV